MTELTKDELTIIAEAVAQQIVSAQRQQVAKRGSPMIREVYKVHEATLKALEAKLLGAVSATLEDLKTAVDNRRTK